MSDKRTKKPKIVTIVGARPQFIKAAVVSYFLRKEYKEVLIHTGQHYDARMSNIFFKELKMPIPDYNLGIGSDTPARQVAFMLEKIEQVLLKEKPNLVLVYGDTNSTLAGALAAAKINIPVVHIEAGLRSFRKDMPEEINRVVTDNLSRLLFCPTRNAVTNLKKEGITRGVYNVGDVMYDAIVLYIKQAKNNSRIISRLNLRRKSYFLATIHRAENTDSRIRLKRIIGILKGLNMPVVFPVHPRTREALKNFKINIEGSQVRFIKPVSYFDMLILEYNAKFILTDSGGVQKEAYLLNVPCLTLREETEWIETVERGSNAVIGINLTRAKEIIKRFDNSPLKNNPGIFGNGQASKKILKILRIYFDVNQRKGISESLGLAKDIIK